MVRLFFCVALAGAATSPLAVGKFCGILGNGQARPQFRILILWISSVADSLEMIEMSSRYHFNNRALFSNYKPMLREKKSKKTNPTPTGNLLWTALDWKSTRRFTDKLADSLQLDY